MIHAAHPQIPSWPTTSIVGAGALLLACVALAYAAGGAPASSVAAGAGGTSATAVAQGDTGAAALAADEGDASDATLRGTAAVEQPAAAPSRPTRRRCSGCGVVIAMREAPYGLSGDGSMSTALPADFGSQWPVAAPTRYIFTVHLEDGGKRLINDLNPLAWRLGERVMIIDGNPVDGR